MRNGLGKEVDVMRAGENIIPRGGQMKRGLHLIRKMNLAWRSVLLQVCSCAVESANLHGWDFLGDHSKRTVERAEESRPNEAPIAERKKELDEALSDISDDADDILNQEVSFSIISISGIFSPLFFQKYCRVFEISIFFFFN